MSQKPLGRNPVARHLFTPADVFLGHVRELARVRQQALDAAYAAHPERFVRGRPAVHLPPANASINPVDDRAPLLIVDALLPPNFATPVAVCS